MSNPRIEEVASDNEDGAVESGSGSSDEMPALEQASSSASAAPQGARKQTRAEKKARKSVSKLGLKAVDGVTRVTIKKSKNILFVMSQADVFKAPHSDTYMVFGEAKIEDMSQTASAQVAEALTGGAGGMDAALAQAQAEAAMAEASGSGAAVAEVDDDEDVDETGIENKDIELVMQQANVTRPRAVRALRNNNSDIVNAILELTSG